VENNGAARWNHATEKIEDFLEANGFGGSVSVSIVPCRIFNRRAFLLRTDQNDRGTGHHPRNIIEIATDVRLRDAYQLKDGDWVEIEFL
jgi:riboflavin kinase, archaea type